MDPYLHTFIAVTLLAVAYYGGRWTGINSGYRFGYLEGAHKGADHLLNILEEEGTYKRKNIEASIERWTEARLEDIFGDDEL